MMKPWMQVIGEFQPRFSGYNQQDSSELLSFLLDGVLMFFTWPPDPFVFAGLHEDLNRVRDKPATPAVESKGRYVSVEPFGLL